MTSALIATAIVLVVLRVTAWSAMLPVSAGVPSTPWRTRRAHKRNRLVLAKALVNRR